MTTGTTKVIMISMTSNTVMPPLRTHVGSRSSRVHLAEGDADSTSAWRGRRRTGGRIGNHLRANVLQQPLEFRVSQDDRPRRGAQPIHGLGRQGERRGLFIKVGALLLISELRKRHVDRVDLRLRDAYRGAER